MTDLVVLTPSRGRPAQLARLAVAIERTTSGRAQLWAFVDEDDPYRGAYVSLGLRVEVGPRRSLVDWTNHGAQLALADCSPTYLASLGDDHVPITADWDLRLMEAIRAMDGPGWAYGNDLLQGQRLPTAWVQHAATVAALGWMMLPTLGHMYPDTVVGALGAATDRLAYVPEVVIEHMHPMAGKAVTDASYRATNSPAQFAQDGRAYHAWQSLRAAADEATVRALTWAVVPC